MVVARWAGRLMCVAGFVVWSMWFGWRLTSPIHGPVGLGALALEVAAVAVAGVMTLALWPAGRGWVGTRRGPRGGLFPDAFAAACGAGDAAIDDAAPAPGADDTGEITMARRGLRLLDPRANSGARRDLFAVAWAAVAIEGIRRMAFVVLLVAVLLSGRFPFDVPSAMTLSMPLVAPAMLAVGHWLLSGGILVPGSRMRWSMASIGAGLGDGISRTGLPIRWAATMATMVVLNLAVSLRGVSDRWTHGLAPMHRDQRVAAMIVAWGLVLAGFAALRTLRQPSLGFYGASRRLEETSTRRLALGTTLTVALVGFVAGVLPGGLPA